MCITTIIGLVVTLNCPMPKPTPLEGIAILQASLTPWTPVLKRPAELPRFYVRELRPTSATATIINVNVTMTAPAREGCGCLVYHLPRGVRFGSRLDSRPPIVRVPGRLEQAAKTSLPRSRAKPAGIRIDGGR